VAGSVAEIAYRRPGGLDQWVMIRGESVSNPPLILLHGGPGFSETGFFRHLNARLEKTFTAIYWDPRGAGKSYDRAIPRSSMTVEQLIGDLDELVGVVCERLGADTVAIFGHSWGSVLGCSTPSASPRRFRRTLAADRLATGGRPSRPRMRSRSRRRSAVEIAGR
jgi:pimeloyl-ACP methyl ester carboxylesterase